MTKHLAPGIKVGPSAIDGLGCFAAARFAKGREIAEYIGEKISRREIARRLRGRRRIHICGIDSYWSIDGSVGGNGSQYINHSCEPNADAVVIDGSMIIFSLQEILPGEEITIDYLNSFASDRTVCQCRAVSCRQSLDLKAS